MNIKFVILPVAIVVLVAGAIGCGGGGSEKSSSDGSAGGSTPASSSLSKEEFIEQAVEACSRAAQQAPEQAAIYLQQHETSKQDEAESRETYTGLVKAVILPTIESQVAAVRSLDAPKGEKAEVEALLSSEERDVAEVAKLKQIVSRFEYERYLAESAKLMREYGLEACANG